MPEPTNYYAGQSDSKVTGVAKPSSTTPKPAPNMGGGIFDSFAKSVKNYDGGNFFNTQLGQSLTPLVGSIGSQNPLLGGALFAAGMGPKDWMTALGAGSQNSGPATLGGFSSSAVKNFRNQREAKPQAGGLLNQVSSAVKKLNPLSFFQKSSQDNVKQVYSPTPQVNRALTVPKENTPATDEWTRLSRLPALSNQGQDNLGQRNQNNYQNQGRFLDGLKFNDQTFAPQWIKENPEAVSAWQKQNPGLPVSELADQVNSAYSRHLNSNYNTFTGSAHRPALMGVVRADAGRHLQWDGGITPTMNYISSIMGDAQEGMGRERTVAPKATDDMSYLDPRRLFPGLAEDYSGQRKVFDDYSTRRSPHYFERAPEGWMVPVETAADAMLSPAREIGMFRFGMDPVSLTGNTLYQGGRTLAGRSPFLTQQIPYRAGLGWQRAATQNPGFTSNSNLLRFAQNPAAYARQYQAAAQQPGLVVNSLHGLGNLASKGQNLSYVGKPLQLAGKASHLGGGLAQSASKWMGPAAGVYTVLGEPAMNAIALAKATPEDAEATLGSQAHRYKSDAYWDSGGFFTDKDTPGFWAGADRYVSRALQGIGEPQFAARELVAGLADTPALFGFQGAGDSIRGQEGQVLNPLGVLTDGAPATVNLSSQVGKLQAVQDAQANLDYFTDPANQKKINEDVIKYNSQPHLQALKQEVESYNQVVGTYRSAAAKGFDRERLTENEYNAAVYMEQQANEYNTTAENKLSTPEFADLIDDMRRQKTNLYNANIISRESLAGDAERALRRAKGLQNKGDSTLLSGAAGVEQMERRNKEKLQSIRGRAEMLEQRLAAGGGNKFSEDPEDLAGIARREAMKAHVLEKDPQITPEIAEKTVDLYFKGPDAWHESMSRVLPVYTDQVAMNESIDLRNAMGQAGEQRWQETYDAARTGNAPKDISDIYQAQMRAELAEYRKKVAPAQRRYEEAKDVTKGITFNSKLREDLEQQGVLARSRAEIKLRQMEQMKKEFGGDYTSWTPAQQDAFDELARDRKKAVGALDATKYISEAISDNTGLFGTDQDEVRKLLRNRYSQALETANQNLERPRSVYTTDLQQGQYDNIISREQFAETPEQFAERVRQGYREWTDRRDVGARNLGMHELVRRLAAQQAVERAAAGR